MREPSWAGSMGIRRSPLPRIEPADLEMALAIGRSLEVVSSSGIETEGKLTDAMSNVLCALSLFSALASVAVVICLR